MNNFIMSGEAISPEYLSEVLSISYQYRSALQQQIIIDIFLRLFPNRFSHFQAKLLSFFARVLLPDESENQLRAHTIVVEMDRSSCQLRGEELLQRKHVQVNEAKMMMLVDGSDILKCEALDWHTPEEQIRFLHSCSLLEDIPKKRLFPILKQSAIKQFRYGQIVHKQGDPMRNSYYFIRSGQFSFSTRLAKSQKESKLLSFKGGYLFHHKSTQPNEQDYEEYLTQKDLESSFDYTVRCHSSSGIVYQIDKDCFDLQFSKFSEEKLQTHLNNQLNYLRKKCEDLEKSAIPNLQLQKRRPLSQQLAPLTAPTISSARSKPLLSVETRILDLFEKPTDYRTVKESLPRRDRLFSKKELKKLCPDAEEDESQALIWRKAKCERLKQLRPKVRPPSRVQILFGFTQSTINFEKSRKKSSLA